MKYAGQKQLLNDVGPLLKRLRISRGWTQDDVIRRLLLIGWNCNRSKYGKIEAQMVRIMDFYIVFFGNLYGDEFKEAFWKLPQRIVGKGHR